MVCVLPFVDVFKSVRIPCCDDAGLAGVTTTITCLDCQKLYDIETWNAATNLERPPTCPKHKTRQIEL